jgi:DNA replication protein DnaC
VTASPGVGKTHLAIGLGREACRRGHRVRFFTATQLATIYAEAREERTVQKLERTIDRRDLIVIDELGYVPLGQNASENLFGFFSRCYERTTLIVTTNLPFSEWPQIFGDERLTGAILDRLTHRVHVFEMDGESYRLKGGRASKGGKKTTKTAAGSGTPEASP